MKPTGVWIIAALTIGAGLPLEAAPAAKGERVERVERGEHRLTGDEIRALASRQLLWCDGYEAATDDCQMVTLVGLLPGGRIGQTATWLEDEKPRLQVYVGETDQIEGDRLCSTVEIAAMPVGFTLEGKPVDEELGAQLRQTLLKRFTELQGKRVCTAYYRGSDLGRLREEVTVNGKRRADLESNYVLRTGEEGFALRVDNDDNAGGSHT